MKAVTWCGKQKVSLDNVPDPKILNPRDAIIRVTTTCICGSDLHLYDGYVPTMEKGDILGHEFMGIVEETGSAVPADKLKKGDRVVIPFTIACGHCWFCKNQYWSCCDNSNPNAAMPEKMYGYSPSALFGYSHMFGGFAGGQAEYVRVPFADVGPYKVPEGLDDEQVIFLTDIFPTGYMAAENCNIKKGDTVAVWGCGPVGQFAIRSAFFLGAERVIAIDDVPGRLKMAADSKAITVDFAQDSLFERLQELTGGRGPDSCIDCVGMEAHGTTVDALYDRVKTATFLATDRLHALRQAINCCRKGGTVSIPGVYAGFLDKVPMGAAFGKGLTLKMGQTHVHKYFKPLMEHIQAGRIDPRFVITHRAKLSDAVQMYDIFSRKKSECIKVVLKP
jgi:threonine dehydrogenase-like Zn-dependent dehydrogenase